MNHKRALALARRRDDRGFRWLFDRDHAVVYRFVRHLAPALDADAARDVAQNTFIRAFNAIEKLEKDDKYESWLLTIARREALRHLERRKAERPAAEIEVACESAERILEKQEKEALILLIRAEADAIEPAVVRETALRYYTGDPPPSTEQVAKELSVPPATVRKRLFLFRKKLRLRLAAKESAV